MFMVQVFVRMITECFLIFIEHALRKEPLPIHGSGDNTRSFCYINDAIESIFKLLFSNANGEAFNIGNPEPEISVKELATRVAHAMPYEVEIVNIDPPHAVYASSDPKRRCPDISKLKSVVDFEPRYGLDEGLKRTIQWFSEGHPKAQNALGGTRNLKPETR